MRASILANLFMRADDTRERLNWAVDFAATVLALYLFFCLTVVRLPGYLHDSTRTLFDVVSLASVACPYLALTMVCGLVYGLVIKAGSLIASAHSKARQVRHRIRTIDFQYSICGLGKRTPQHYNIRKARCYSHATRGHKRKDTSDSRLPVDGEYGETERSFCSSTGVHWKTWGVRRLETTQSECESSNLDSRFVCAPSTVLRRVESHQTVRCFWCVH